MARGGTRKPSVRPSETPPALPPERRPVGQLVAETIRLYGRRFFPALLLGLPLAVADEISFRHGLLFRALTLWALTPLITAAFVAACALTLESRRSRRALGGAFAVGLVVF